MLALLSGAPTLRELVSRVLCCEDLDAQVSLQELYGDLANFMKTSSFLDKMGCKSLPTCYSYSFSSLGCRLSCQRQKA